MKNSEQVLKSCDCS